MIEKIFKLKENKTTIRIEILAGLSTFMTMAYIIQLNPNLLTNFAIGTPLWNAVFMATILSACIGTFLMAFIANKPLALAPGMGLNSYFAVVVTSIAVAAGVTYEEAFGGGLAIILISGILFTILTLLKIREKIVDAIPKSIRLGITAGIGLMLVQIGLSSNAAVYHENGSSTMIGFFAQGARATKEQMGEAYGTMLLYLLTLFVGLFVIIVLHYKKVKGSILIGMVVASAVYWMGLLIQGQDPFVSLKGASFLPPFQDMFQTTFFKFDFEILLNLGLASAIMTVISFCMVDMFDTIGALLGTAKAANLYDEKGEIKGMSRAMLSDSLATCVGACTGTSTVTTFIESAAGVEEGGRTGFASVITGLCFLACMFFAPIAALIPPPATSAALVFVGVLMISSLKEVDYQDISASVSVVLMLVIMIMTSGIGTGIGIGLIAYTIIKIFTGKAKEVSVLTIVLSLLFLIKFFFL